MITAAAGLAAGGRGGRMRGLRPPPPGPPTEAPPPIRRSPTPVAAGSAGTPVAATGDVPIGGALVVEALELVVTQPEAGRFTGLSAVCTHTGCIVNRVDEPRSSAPATAAATAWTAPSRPARHPAHWTRARYPS